MALKVKKLSLEVKKAIYRVRVVTYVVMVIFIVGFLSFTIAKFATRRLDSYMNTSLPSLMSVVPNASPLPPLFPVPFQSWS